MKEDTPPLSPLEGQEDLSFKIRDFPSYFKKYIADVVDLKRGVDAPAVIEEIRNKRSLAGANAWMLMCSIVIASIGLSQNSQAVIIGAMLISPLMSPILGIGLSIGINDMATLRGSMAHFAIAIFIALLTSYIYFTISPFNGLTEEISARTKPTFLDIFVAIFGGLAGIISTSRKDISTTIPGVAIATALMPPLCVTGYGLAINDPDIASKAFYYFFLNTFFVALSTYFIVRFLKFPQHKYPNKKAFRKNLVLIIAFSLALVIPSFFIFRNVLREQRLDNNLKQFNIVCLGEKSIYLDSYNTGIDQNGNKILYLKVYGNAISSEHKEEYLDCLSSLGVKGYDLNIIATSDVNINQIEILEHNLESIADEIERNQVTNSVVIDKINYLQKAHVDSALFDNVRLEIKEIFPEIKEFGFSNIHFSNPDTTFHDIPAIFVNWSNINRSQIQANNRKVYGFMRERLDIDTFKIITY